MDADIPSFSKYCAEEGRPHPRRSALRFNVVFTCAISRSSTPTCMHACMCMHVCMYVFTDVCMCVCMNVCGCGCGCVCVGVCVRMDMCMYVCLDAHLLHTNRTSLVDGPGHLSHAIRHHLQGKQPRVSTRVSVRVCACVCARTHTHPQRQKSMPSCCSCVYTTTSQRNRLLLSGSYDCIGWG